MNKALTELLGVQTRTIGASRTDTGVHARGNVAVFDTESRMPASRIAFALNTYLPEDIRVRVPGGIRGLPSPVYQHR